MFVKAVKTVSVQDFEVNTMGGGGDAEPTQSCQSVFNE